MRWKVMEGTSEMERVRVRWKGMEGTSEMERIGGYE